MGICAILNLALLNFLSLFYILPCPQNNLTQFFLTKLNKTQNHVILQYIYISLFMSRFPLCTTNLRLPVVDEDYAMGFCKKKR